MGQKLTQSALVFEAFLCLRHTAIQCRSNTDPNPEEIFVASITYAAVIATVLFLLFERTRAFGVIGVFVLISTRPVLFSLLFVSLAILYITTKPKRK